MHGELHKSVTNFPSLFVLFLPPFRLYFCVGKEMWNTPGQRRERPLEDFDGHELFGSLIEWESASGLLS